MRKASEKTRGEMGRTVRPFFPPFFRLLFSAPLPILRTFPHYLNAWNRLLAQKLPCFRQNWSKSILYFRPERLKKKKKQAPGDNPSVVDSPELFPAVKSAVL